MCGIVGYIGTKHAQSILLTGLKRLEYRGYDSAGVVTLTDAGKPTLLRAVGKVAALETKIATHNTSNTWGIGHTRWATHGGPSKANAHPHQVGDIYVVHNGIIENYQDLKVMLKRHDYDFKSDTDTDGLAVVSSRLPGEVVVARKGSPLILGVGKGETFIASDASALVGHTDKVIYMHDGEIGRCTREGVELYDIEVQPLTVTTEELSLDLEAIQKKGYDHFLLKEIHDQPESLRATLSGRITADKKQAHLGGLNMTNEELSAVRHVVIVGCGTSYYAGTLAAYIIEQFLDDVTFSIEIASELRYRSFYIPEDSVALIVSQSGETADTLACLQELKRRGVRTLGVVNSVGSSIAREVDGGMYLHAGAEISVASTKAFTSQVAAMVLFGLTVAGAKGVGQKVLSEYLEELAALPDELEKTITHLEPVVKKLAKKYAHYGRALYCGRDTAYPVALEGALKLKEVAYVQAEAHAAGELKHGSIALVDDNVFEMFYLQDNWLYHKAQSNLIEIVARDGHAIVITNTPKTVKAETVLRIPTKLSLLVPLVFNAASQLFAYYMAVQRGHDVDQPRNLAKSVTVE